MLGLPDITLGHGSGSSLPLPVLTLAGISTFVAVIVSGISIWLQLRNYRKPLLQRMVVRIMVMVPLYAISSFISLFSLEAAFFIDAIRDIYEAFVIYCFFVLLLDYLGGERSLLILLHGRPPVPAVFPVSLWRNEIDQSDPYTYLSLKRGILRRAIPPLYLHYVQPQIEYVQVKPILAFASLVMKATGTYNEGDFRAQSGYLYVSIVYNVSICLALWCLAVFWMCVNEDLKPFRPVPKFLCVKGILFFSFWQSIAISFLVAVGVITRLGPYTDNEHISLGLTDTLICIEMPFFAAAHMYAFSYRDFTQPPASAATGKVGSPIYVARMTLGYALRDAFGLKDLVEDTLATLRGEGINYRAFEPSEGAMHIGAARDRRIRAGLRYTEGGKRKYWLPEVRADDRDVTAPLFAAEADEVVHDAPDMQHRRGAGRIPGHYPDVDEEDSDEYALTFGDALAGPEGVDEVLYEDAKKYVFGDYLYPVVDVSSEEARRAMWVAEERVVRDIASGFSRSVAFSGYGATQSGMRHTRVYEDQGDAVGDQGGPPRTPSPPRSREISDCPPITPHTHASSQQSHSPTQASTRLRLPRLLSPSVSRSVSAGGSSVNGASPSRKKRAPLVEEDAVDLVVSSDSLQVPTTSRGPHSPHVPVLIRVWEEANGGGEREREEREEGQRGDASKDVRFVVSADKSETEMDGRGLGEDGGVQGVVRAQTPPLYARTLGYGIPDDEDDHNPWA